MQSAGYRPIVENDAIFLDESRAIEHSDSIAQILVNAGAPPTHLAVKQQDLEEHFMELTRGWQ